MSFRENILSKIEANRLAKKVNASLASSGEIQKVDKASMRELLTKAGYGRRDTRDLELYIPEGNEEKKRIVVLDNGLGIYHTTVEDVAMRKSPTVKEMVSIRNAIKILKDDDVLVCKKEDTVARIRDELITGLDLSYTAEDLEAIRLDGSASLEGGYADGIIESIEIFGEILDFSLPPKAFAQRHCFQRGQRVKDEGGAESYGPAVLFNRVHQTLVMIETAIRPSDREAMSRFSGIAENSRKAPVEGTEVFSRLAQMAASQNG